MATLQQVPFGFVVAFFGAVGLLVGSFLNVVIHRLPRGESVVRPRSRCPGCGAGVRAADNIPVLSWVLLRGRCRACGWAIPLRYPLIEAVTGGLYALVAWHVAPALLLGDGMFALAALHGLLLVTLLVGVTMIDLDHMIIPDSMSLGGTVAALALSFVASPATGVTWQLAGAGALAGALFFVLVSVLYFLVRRREGMGFGDVKLIACIGAFCGLGAIPFVIFGASIQGTLVAVLWYALGGRNEDVPDVEPGVEAGEHGPDDAVEGVPAEDDEALPPIGGPGLGGFAVPFGPFLALAAVEWYFLGHALLPHLPGL